MPWILASLCCKRRITWSALASRWLLGLSEMNMRPVGHGLIGNVLRGLGKADDQSGVLLRKEALGHDRVEISRQCDGAEHHHERAEAMPQHDLQSGLIEVEKGIETSFEEAIDAAMLLAFRLEQARAHHRGERQWDHQREYKSHAHGDGKFTE